MSSALDRQLIEYQSRPKDESGARKTKQSLIFDPKEASFIDSDTFYQIGYQGFVKLQEKEPRLSEFENSIFSYANSQIDPLFLTASENQQIFDEIENLLYLISDYILLPETVQILEYLIQHFAVNRLCPSILILTILPYLETSFFTRVLQTIPFKALPHEFKILRPFGSVALSKKPMSRKILKDWINSRPVLFQWIVGSANKFAITHPRGTFASFVGVLFTELALETTNDIIIRSIIDSCKSSLNSEDPALAPYTLMAVCSVNEKQQLNQQILKTFSQLIHQNIDLLHNHFNSMFLAAVYFSEHSDTPPSVGFISALGHHLQELDQLSKKYELRKFVESCIKTISSNLTNDDLIRSLIAILETSFFDETSTLLMLNISQNYNETEYSQELIQSIVSHYPTSVTTEVLEALNKSNVKIDPSQISPHNLINQLSNPENLASLYSNPELPYEIASKQVVNSLVISQNHNQTDAIIPILQYFEGRAPENLLKYLPRRITEY
ncbi:HEAT repeat-containing protein 1 [Histomonas meleagridis]|uniref:HEAT repeat-containing protein 1 n=1 Tax=Histomonas meleagridis TaxID=135588 RepID=UPI00355A0BF0|nr:HEAT repeat-containing protein 1 [Histomonas meleagridis]KAH0804057.1 HEAT repeat-containing protein 1 [Histomonas meleagridis]